MRPFQPDGAITFLSPLFLLERLDLWIGKEIQGQQREILEVLIDGHGSGGLVFVILVMPV